MGDPPKQRRIFGPPQSDEAILNLRMRNELAEMTRQRDKWRELHWANREEVARLARIYAQVESLGEAAARSLEEDDPVAALAFLNRARALHAEWDRSRRRP